MHARATRGQLGRLKKGVTDLSAGLSATYTVSRERVSTAEIFTYEMDIFNEIMAGLAGVEVPDETAVPADGNETAAAAFSDDPCDFYVTCSLESDLLVLIGFTLLAALPVCFYLYRPRPAADRKKA